jgi:hypothetical protein
VHLYPLPAWSPQSNPVEPIWWSLHEAVSRNHNCEQLSELLEFAQGYLRERQPFYPKLGADYEQLEGRRLERGKCPFILWSYLQQISMWLTRIAW